MTKQYCSQKNRLNHIDGLISKALVDSYLSHDQFVSVNDELREYNEMRKKSKIQRMLGHAVYKYGWYKQRITQKIMHKQY